jgi:hypothetical protein
MKGGEMNEAKASWNTIYQAKEGFECQITLRDEEEASLIDRARRVMASIVHSGGLPVRRKQNEVGNALEGAKEERWEKTYLDANGVRRCNFRLKDGRICSQPVTEREGRYGTFWSCPNFREHAS